MHIHFEQNQPIFSWLSSHIEDNLLQIAWDPTEIYEDASIYKVTSAWNFSLLLTTQMSDTSSTSRIPTSLLKMSSICDVYPSIKISLGCLSHPAVEVTQKSKSEIKCLLCAVRTVRSHWTRHTVWTELWLAGCSFLHSDYRLSPTGLSATPV